MGPSIGPSAPRMDGHLAVRRSRVTAPHDWLRWEGGGIFLGWRGGLG